jgi:hypothetical protein
VRFTPQFLRALHLELFSKPSFQGVCKLLKILDSSACPGPDPRFAGMTEKGIFRVFTISSILFHFAFITACPFPLFYPISRGLASYDRCGIETHPAYRTWAGAVRFLGWDHDARE